MLARIYSKTGALTGIDFSIEKEAVIGRDSHCDIVLYPQTISSRHARIFLDTDRNAFFVEDLGSSNGTRVDRKLVTKPTRLDRLNVITLAVDIDLIFQVLADHKQKPATSQATPAKDDGLTKVQQDFSLPDAIPEASGEREKKSATQFQQDFNLPDIIPGAIPEDQGKPTTVRERFAAPPEIPDSDDTAPSIPPLPPPIRRVFTLVVQNADESRQRYQLDKKETILGRSPACDIILKDRFISSRHAVIRLSGDKIYIKDLGSSNETFVENKPISEEVQITPGMVARLGPGTKITIE